MLARGSAGGIGVHGPWVVVLLRVHAVGQIGGVHEQSASSVCPVGQVLVQIGGGVHEQSASSVCPVGQVLVQIGGGVHEQSASSVCPVGQVLVQIGGGGGGVTGTGLQFEGELPPGHDLMTSCVCVSLPMSLICHMSFAVQPG